MKISEYNYNGSKIKYYYALSEQEIVPIHITMQILDEIRINIEKYIGSNLMKNILFEFYSNKLPNINQLMSFGNNQVAVGLATYFSSSNKSIKIGCFTDGVRFEDYKKWYSDILSHEIGHLFEKEIKWDIKNKVRDEWDKLRGYTAKYENIYEVFAEDFRVQFGATLARYHRRSEYASASLLPSIKDLLSIYKDLNEYVINNPVNIARFDYGINTLNGCMLTVYSVFDVFKIFPIYYYFNKFGIYLFQNNLWKQIKVY